ncbi:hypothetical protein EDB87DRAFT_898480 [Lactarius vividus]|nr:hypothetical protein EDB87DRAFT_898480 [Lactarius vividus]
MSTVPWSEVWPYSFMLTVTLSATLTPAYNHQFFFFSSTDAILLQAVPPFHIFGSRRLATLLLLYVLEPIPPPPLLRPCFSQPYCCCSKTLYLFLTQSLLHSSLSGNCPCPRTRCCCPPTLHFSLLSREGERGGRGLRVLLMYGLEIALAKPINSCSYLGC